MAQEPQKRKIVQLFLQRAVSPPTVGRTIIYTFITYVLGFFLPEPNAPDYASSGHTRAPVRRMLSVCGGDSSGKHEADKRLLFCKQSSDLRRLSFSPFHTGLFCIGPKLRPLRYRFPGGRFNSITVCCMLRWAVALDVLTFKIPSNCKWKKAGVPPAFREQNFQDVKCVELFDFNLKVCSFQICCRNHSEPNRSSEMDLPKTRHQFKNGVFKMNHCTAPLEHFWC